MSKEYVDICPKCGGNMDMEKILDDSRELWECQLCGKVKRIVKWLSNSEYEIEREWEDGNHDYQ